jgi:hypothetical protein
MIHRKVLEAKGCTAARLREIFTCKDSSAPEHKIRKKFEDRINARVTSGFSTSIVNARLYQAVDIAMDSTPIQPEAIPLLLWAQGKITKEVFVKQVSGTALADQYLVKEKRTDGKETISIDTPKLFEVSVNIIRAYTSRRMATQTARFSNLWPYFKYEPRGTDEVAKIRGDAVSQRIDQMADSYNYRHFWPQTFRHHFIYARSVVFARSAWDRKTSWRAKDLNLPADKIEIESYIEREGLDFVAPHPSRVFRDTSAPLPNVNVDTGPSYIGYWDIVPYRTFTQGEYFNIDQVTFGESTSELLSKFGNYFQYYFDPKVLDWPQGRYQNDPSAGNDRTVNVGRYSSEDCDKGCLAVQYYERINPKHEGIADLNVDVWMRLTVAGDNTVTAGEFLTTIPACYGGLNENDDRLVSPSQAMELMAYQDQLTNLFSQLLATIRTGMMQIWAVDSDALDPAMKQYIQDSMASGKVYNQPQAFFYSGAKLAELGLQNPGQNPRAFLSIIQAQVLTSVEQIYRAIGEVLAMADRMLMVSPNEQAQPNPREVAAREITEISSSTSAISTFVSDGIDEQRAAAKRMCFESLVCESTAEFMLPVINRYKASTIKKAGFKIVGEELPDDQIVPLTTTIVGNAQNLNYEYYFDSRDGADRALNSQGAQIMSQLFGQMSQNEGLMQALGKRRVFEIWNEIFRMSGAAYDLKLDDGEDESVAGAAGMDDRIKQIEQAVTQLMQQLGVPAPGQAPQPEAPAGPAPALAPTEPPAEEGSAPEELPAALRGE